MLRISFRSISVQKRRLFDFRSSSASAQKPNYSQQTHSNNSISVRFLPRAFGQKVIAHDDFPFELTAHNLNHFFFK